MVGRVNYDLWWNVVGFYVDDLRIFKYFPNQPDVSYIIIWFHFHNLFPWQERKMLEQLHVGFHGDSPHSSTGRYGHKVYGYFLPPKPGESGTPVHGVGRY